MKNIRRSVFETNSSSMHSLSIIGSSNMVSKDKFGKITRVKYGEYGWGYDRLSTPVEKLSYMITEYKDNDYMFDLVIKTFEDYTGSTVIIEELDDGYYPKGYIDHQSHGTIDDVLSDSITIRDILFDYKYSIIIDNDNH